MLRKATRKFTTTLSSPGIIDAVSDTFTLANTTNLPTDTQVDLTIDRVDSSGTLTPAKEEVITGTVSGSNIIGAVRGVEGTAQAHSAGAVVEVRLTASQWNDAIDEMIRLRSNNYQIVPTVSGNNLTVALKTLAGNDPSALDPVRVRIGNTIHSITSALSVTKNAGTNWLNMGSAELATKEVDLFVNLFWSQEDSDVRMLITRIPYANTFGELTGSQTAEKGYLLPDTPSYEATSTDTGVVIGRFAATLSAGAGYTWSVPTFTATNLVNRPIYETRALTWQPTLSASESMTWGPMTTVVNNYKIVGSLCYVELYAYGTTAGTASYAINATFPFQPKAGLFNGPAGIKNGGGSMTGAIEGGEPGYPASFRMYDGSNFGLGANRAIKTIQVYEI